MKAIEIINSKIEEIKEQTGITLIPCDHFDGIRNHNGKSYFNVITEKRISESNHFGMISKLIDKGVISNIEPNGVNRLAIFL